MLKYIFQIKYTETILSNSTRKLLWFEITKIIIAVKEKNIVSFIIIFGTLSFPIVLFRKHVRWMAAKLSLLESLLPLPA